METSSGGGKMGCYPCRMPHPTTVAQYLTQNTGTLVAGCLCTNSIGQKVTSGMSQAAALQICRAHGAGADRTFHKEGLPACASLFHLFSCETVRDFLILF